MTIYKLRKESLEETNPANILITDFQPPELQENKFLSFEPPIPLYFVMQPELTDTSGEAHTSVSGDLASRAVQFFCWVVEACGGVQGRSYTSIDPWPSSVPGALALEPLKGDTVSCLGGTGMEVGDGGLRI